ncbi:hypothetical protein RFI_19971 [Reticulomyxa filosa]|uniref:Uncharacterized protein n=1 Tax=Reticulomyxa filosa TaxID=46433 RepID=X6MUL3_RETFI|nr:hypothetical protein RFI_19971 [Reticulomyxa filosa]|eukprot:ETO17351.1 hypothetical protein RFI_19971 [Reticulomyxa filosa]
MKYTLCGKYEDGFQLYQQLWEKHLSQMKLDDIVENFSDVSFVQTLLIASLVFIYIGHNHFFIENENENENEIEKIIAKPLLAIDYLKRIKEWYNSCHIAQEWSTNDINVAMTDTRFIQEIEYMYCYWNDKHQSMKTSVDCPYSTAFFYGHFLLHLKQDFQAALAAFKQQLSRRPLCALTHAWMAQCYMQLEQHQLAKDFLHKALSLNPKVKPVQTFAFKYTKLLQ